MREVDGTDLGGIRRRAAQRYMHNKFGDAADDVEALLAVIDDLIGTRPPYHVLEVDDRGDWSLQHEAHCFPDLLSCPIHATMSAVMPGSALPAGRYQLAHNGAIVRQVASHG